MSAGLFQRRNLINNLLHLPVFQPNTPAEKILHETDWPSPWWHLSGKIYQSIAMNWKGPSPSAWDIKTGVSASSENIGSRPQPLQLTRYCSPFSGGKATNEHKKCVHRFYIRCTHFFYVNKLLFLSASTLFHQKQASPAAPEISVAAGFFYAFSSTSR